MEANFEKWEYISTPIDSRKLKEKKSFKETGIPELWNNIQLQELFAQKSSLISQWNLKYKNNSLNLKLQQVNEKISLAQQGNIKKTELKIETKNWVKNVFNEQQTKLEQVKVWTSNDNLFTSEWKDDGHTFWVGVETKFSKNNKDYFIKWKLDSYTDNPDYLWKDGRIWKRDLNRAWSRVDSIELEMWEEGISLLKDTWLWISVTAKKWVWIQAIWNFWGEWIQNSFHNSVIWKEFLNHPPQVLAPYEKTRVWGFISGEIDISKSFNNNPLFVWWKMSGKLNVVWKGKTSIDAQLYTWIDTKWVNLSIAYWNTQSIWINSWTMQRWVYEWWYIQANARIWKWKGLFWYASLRKNSNNNESQWTIWLWFDF